MDLKTNVNLRSTELLLAYGGKVKGYEIQEGNVRLKIEHSQEFRDATGHAYYNMDILDQDPKTQKQTIGYVIFNGDSFIKAPIAKLQEKEVSRFYNLMSRVEFTAEPSEDFFENYAKKTNEFLCNAGNEKLGNNVREGRASLGSVLSQVIQDRQVARLLQSGEIQTLKAMLDYCAINSMEQIK